MDRKVLSGLKRIELSISREQVNDVLQIFDELKLEATLYNLHGLGKSRKILRVRKSCDQSQTKASDRKTIITIAYAELLENLVKKIKGL